MKFIVGATFAILASVWHVPAAADALHDIERFELARTLDAQLVADLDREPELAARAALAIGRTKKTDGIAPLRAHLATHDHALRAMCAYALGLIGSTEALPSLRALARHDSNSAVRYAAIDAVGRIALGHARAATQAVANDTIIVARTDADPVVRAHAAAQLDVFKDPAIAKTLAPSLERALARERDQTVRWHLAWAIFRGYARAVDGRFLTHALHDRNELVRVEAARAWGRRVDRDATKIVTGALDDPSWRVQFEAREALRRLAKLPPTDHLIVDPPGIHLPTIAAPSLDLSPAAGDASAPPIAGPSPTPSPTFATPTPTVPPTALSPTDPSRLSTPVVASPAALASAAPSTRPTGGNATAAANAALRPPMAQTLALVPPVLPLHAGDMNAPASGPHPRVSIVTTKGMVIVRLYPEWAPSTVANFLNLVTRRYFDGNRWFRIVPDFVVQTGDPNDNGDGDAGYMIPAEENPLEQRSGTIAMGLNYDTNGALRDSAGTQFYVTLSPQLHLDRDFSVFGEISSGFDVLANLVENDRMVVVRRISDG